MCVVFEGIAAVGRRSQERSYDPMRVVSCGFQGMMPSATNVRSLEYCSFYRVESIPKGKTTLSILSRYRK